MVKKMVEGSTTFKMVINIKELFIKIVDMEKVLLDGKMAAVIQVIGIIGRPKRSIIFH